MQETNLTPTLALVIPCYNEALSIVKTISVLTAHLQLLINNGFINAKSYALYIDDGSLDDTWHLVEQHANEQVKGIKLSNNTGHQKALLAGLHYCINKCNCCISLDADLQDDISVIEKMILAYNSGSQIVYGVRDDRSVDSFFKKTTAQLFYKILRWMKIDVVFNHADFRLASNPVLKELEKYRESHIFLRGIFPLLGYKNDLVYYERLSREHGETKYSISKMAKLAMDGITSFSGFPLRLITITGFVVFIGCIFAIIWVLVVMLLGKNIPGWASISLPIYFLGGIQLLALGIIGTYVNKIFEESKKRPLYHIEKNI